MITYSNNQARLLNFTPYKLKLEGVKTKSPYIKLEDVITGKIIYWPRADRLPSCCKVVGE